MPPSSVQHQRRLSARPSSIDLRSSRVATDGKQQSVSNFNPTLSSVKLRLDEKNNNNKHSATAVIKQREEDLCLMRRCEACNRRNDSQCNHNNMMTERQENKGMGGLVSGYASSIPIHQLRETIIEDLTSSIVSYSNQIQDLSNAISISFSSTSFETLAFKRVYYREQQSGATYRSQIKECKALIVQQKELLDRLEELVFEEENHHEQQVMLKQPTTSIDQSSRLLRKFKDSLVKPTGLTQLVIRQNKLKKKDTIISIQGICETKESSLIPNKLLSEKKSVYYFQYALDIHHHDRLTKFTLLPSSQWKKDEQVHQCQFKPCSTQFGLFERRHHCRRCGDIYCSSHSQNRLPLFTPKDPYNPTFYRVCDCCFFELTSQNLSPY
ncbi:hypothetical protein CU097_005498 [Rhizopus azygosporus]|uniref:FYVE-type domain-containing protein n=1 Tax=Rhizopus azygosporus TaxID=86630 RepID=A0A367J3X7_RHIAZ|nr:hypothetical protein CU097_005498 [Rhizopus azygosporus]